MTVRMPPTSARVDEAARRTEILQTANAVIAASGLRTSLQQIADAAGILAGSLYHHFESKEAILVELIRRYHADLDLVGDDALARAAEPDPRSPRDQIIDLGRALACCAVQHRAALQMSFYEGPSSDPELMDLTRRRPAKAIAAMLQTLRSARGSGYLEPDIELPILADRMTQSMLRVGIDTIRRKASCDAVATQLCKILLDGLAAKRPPDRRLDRSKAYAAAQDVIGTWVDDDNDGTDKAAHIRAVARAEFGRRGYEMTTIRDIASASGLATGSVYRAIGSKDELLMSIMLSFGQKVGGRLVERAGDRCLTAGEARRAQLDQHQCPRPLSGRVPNPARMDAAVAARHDRTWVGLEHPHPRGESASVRGY